MADPITDGHGRDQLGRFGPGNTAARGRSNPQARHVVRLRTAVLGAVSAGDIREIMKKLVELAKAGDVAAAREVLKRTAGRVPEAIEAQERQEIEARAIQACRCGESFDPEIGPF